MIRRAFLAAVIVLAMPAASPTAQTPAAAWAITGGVLIDGTGAAPLTASVIVGQGDRLACVGRAAECAIPEGAAILNASGKWVIPGLIDTHVHLNWNADENARLPQLIRLAFGTTTTRDAGTPGQLDRTLTARARADTPESPEPRLVVSGLVTPGKDQQDAAAVSGLVRQLASQGVDAIKFKQELTPDAFSALVREAHGFGLPVFGHTWGRQGSFLPATLAAGIDGVSHMYTFSEFGTRADPARPPAPTGLAYWVWTKELWNHQDDARLREAADMLVERGAWVEPMLVTEKHFTIDYPLSDDVAYLGEVRSLEQILRSWLPVGETGWPARRKREARIDAVYGKMCEFVGRFNQRGGVVIAGTDGLQPGPALLDEIALLTECGLTPMAALRSATERAAIALKRPDLGTIEAGKRADLVVLDADPLARPENLRRVFRVVKGGHGHDPAVLMRPVLSAHDARRRAAWTARAAGGSTVLAVTGLLTVLQRRRRRQRRLPT